MIGNRSGMALVVVLGVISVLLATGIHLARITGESATGAGVEAARFEARQMAMAGIHLAMLLLADDAAQNTTDSVQEVWADPDKLAQAVDRLGYPGDSLSLEIEDELGKIQVNALVRAFPGNELNPDQALLWERLQTNGLPDSLPGDRIDLDEVPAALAGSPFNTVDELQYGTGAGGPAFLDRLWPDTAEKQDLPSLSDLFTVHGLSHDPLRPDTFHWTGRININTAGLWVLRSLLDSEMTQYAQDLLDYRIQKSEDGQTFANVLDKGWYTRVIDLTQKERLFFERMIRYDSHLFKATASARLDRAAVTLTAVIERERREKTGQRTCRIIQMERR
jgi:general secretion pathway protein K